MTSAPAALGLALAMLGPVEDLGLGGREKPIKPMYPPTEQTEVVVVEGASGPCPPSGIIMFLQEIRARTPSRKVESFYFLSMRTGQAYPKRGQTCLLKWVPDHRFEAGCPWTNSPPKQYKLVMDWSCNPALPQ